MKHRFTWLACAALLATLTCGCGQAQESRSDSDRPAPDPTTAQPSLATFNHLIEQKADQLNSQRTKVEQPAHWLSFATPNAVYFPKSVGRADPATATELRWLADRRMKTFRMHGTDDRLSIWELQMQSTLSPQLRARVQQSRAVLALFRPSFIVKKNEIWEVSGLSLQDRFKLCEGEKYAHELTAVHCTAFLISPTVAVTARHCIKPSEQTNEQEFAGELIAAAHYWTRSATDIGNNVPATHITKVRRVTRLGATERQDWAVIELAAPLPDTETLRLSDSADIPIDQGVHAFGFPHGLPMKFAGTAKVTRTQRDDPTFVASLDVFTGNSGSPVINTSTNEVAGIVSKVHGNDWEPVERTRVVNGVPHKESCSIPLACINAPGFTRCEIEGERIFRASLVRREIGTMPLARVTPSEISNVSSRIALSK